MKKLNIGIIGVGMVGKPLMNWFLKKGWERGKNLFCYDTDPKKGYFDSVTEASIVFICVPTPSNPDGSCNISVVESVVNQLPDNSKRIVVIKSTVPPGTVVGFAEKYKAKGVFLFNPEFLTESQAWEDFIRPDRQIVAYSNSESRKWASVVLRILPVATFQSPGVLGTTSFYEIRSSEAELAKYASNLFGSLKVVFANVLADICQALELDYEQVRFIVSHDRRIGDSWMDVYYGNYRGFGGYCFPKDFKALMFQLKRCAEKEEDMPVKTKRLLSKGLKILEAIWDYNLELLGSQGLGIDEISLHEFQVDKKRQ
jgi:nucleotide sugar dehydrogenase